MQDQAPGDGRGDGWKGSWGPVRVRLTDLAEDYARLLSSQDPAAAEATGLPSRVLLPDVGPEALAERSMVERRLHQLVRAVETPRSLTDGHGARSDGPGDDARDSRPGDGDPWGTAPSAVRVLRAHLLERLETSIDLIDSADQGAELNILTSPFQGVRRRLTTLPTDLPGSTSSVQDWADLGDRYRAAPRALAGIRDSLAVSAAQGVLPPRGQVEAIARQTDDLARVLGSRSRGETGDGGNGLPEGVLGRDLQAAAANAAQAVAGLGRYLRGELAPLAPAREGVGPSRHARWVRRMLGTSIDTAEVYQWARQELVDVVAAQDALAAEVLGTGARAGDLDAHLRADPSTGMSPEDFPRWAQGVADEAWDAVVGHLLDVPACLGRPTVLLDTPGGGVHYEEPEPSRSLPGRVLRSFAVGDETVWPWVERTTVLHESVPGHHAHSGAQSLDPSLTLWQRHLGKVPGCNEGWALYAERLAIETGLLSKPADRFGWLAARRWRIVRVLVDLGVHSWLPVPADIAALPGAGGGTRWDRPTVEAALRAHTVLGEGFLQFEVDKQLGWPAQGLAYVLGERVWLVGRERAQHSARAAGEELDLRAFHNRGIGLGSVGLDLLTRELG
ncbi:DUF885 domain-containing protein [Actinomyces naeslundii]|uniref:DUF885 domain-containing protein n=1 Tax=Actinomyces naeslundii TaxID=1655 RepID=UPI00096C69E9|nr:DUF885 domain-containing protein [Actinomyces naeslundii]OMG14732.1 hypothetical protein BKH08_00470 [Actinomyces naeslundii]